MQKRKTCCVGRRKNKESKGKKKGTDREAPSLIQAAQATFIINRPIIVSPRQILPGEVVGEEGIDEDEKATSRLENMLWEIQGGCVVIQSKDVGAGNGE